LMALVLVALLVAGRRVAGRPGWTERFVCYACLGAVGVVFTRFDLLPALAVLLAVERGRAGRWSAAWTWAVLGGVVKMFPALLLPGFAIAEWRASGRFPWRRVGVTAAVVSAAGVVQSWYAPGSFLRPLTYELHRGFEFSSVPGTLSLLLSPAHLRFSFAYGNHQVAGAGGAAVGVLVALAAVGSLVAVWALTAGGRMPVEATALAVLSVAVLTDKALAPQYLLWLMPLWAYWRLRPSWLVAAALTTVVFPVVFPVLFLAVHGTSLYADTVVAAVRNAVLVGGSVAWLVEGLSTDWAGRRRTDRPGGNRMEVVACSVSV
jgi:hypothetical protein